MVWQKNQAQKERIETESFVNKTINNIIDFDFKVACGEINDATYIQRYRWLVNTAEAACEGARLIKHSNAFVDYENLTETQKNFLDAAKKLFIERNSKMNAGGIEIQARHALEQIVLGIYDAKVNAKQSELDEAIKQGKINSEQASLELARYRFRLLIEAAEGNKTIRKEMSQ